MREDIALAVKDIHKYLAGKGFTYFEVRWVLDVLTREYERKSCQLLDDTKIEELAAVKKEHGKEYLF